jgi:threonine aldolase
MSASLLDDIARLDPSTKDLEKFMADITGTEAALFVPSGTMGNICSLRALLTQPPYGILCDSRAHILASEGGGAFAFSGALPQPVVASNDQYITLEDVRQQVQLESENQVVHMCPTRVIALENTIRGMIHPLEEVRRICEFAHAHDIRVHLDGARLWEVVSAGEGTLADYCSLVDTATMCFSKGLGAPAGSIIVGKHSAVQHARWIRQSIGGSIRQPGPLVAMAHLAVKNTFMKGLLKRTHIVASDIASFWESHGGKLQHPTQTNMIWLDFTQEDFKMKDFIDIAASKGVLVHRNRLIVHYREYHVISLLPCSILSAQILTN